MQLNGWDRALKVTADGKGLVGHAGAIATASDTSTVPRSSNGELPFLRRAADSPAVRASWSAALRSRTAPA